MKSFYQGMLLTLVLTSAPQALADDIHNSEWLQQQLNQGIEAAFSTIKMAATDTQTLARHSINTDGNEQAELAELASQTESKPVTTERRLSE